LKLYLSSYLIGDYPDRLLSMAGGHGARMAIITNALDNIPLEAQLDYARNRFDPVAYFAGYGFDASLLDLRYYFGQTAPLREVLLRNQVVWALGGNTFLLRRAMRQSGFDQIIGDLLAQGLVYGGWSAGACVAGDSLRAVGVMDEPGAAAPGYQLNDPVWDGLGLVPFSIIPHFQSQHREAPLAEKAVQWAADHGIEFRSLRDGEVIVRTARKATVLPRLS
jgi:dipeptidase E